MSRWSPPPVNDDLGGPLPNIGKLPATKAKRARIIKAAKRHFAKHGFENARMQDLAKNLRISKGSIFQHFGSKDRLFLETLKSTELFQQKYLDAPAEVVSKGFYATLRYWFEWVESLSEEDWVDFRLQIIGIYATNLRVKREISRFLRTEDPAGVLDFIHFGIERGQIRTDIEPLLLAKTLNIMADGFLDARFAVECDTGLIRTNGKPVESIGDLRDQYLELIRGAMGMHQSSN